MPARYLAVPREQKCIGCRLCSLAASRYENRMLGIKGSPITVKGKPTMYKIQIDYGKVIKNIDKIVSICPQNCFDIVSS
ncbi:hypothetical protein A2982_00455 [candidate division WWE3 bacterium RIFCSPLOWO2_01_FULL_39_13]|uniref:4Fe-4S ferredoxin-type domain-containing protein n=1 Tax=candidate division WWE3 bacterium RIFCSPLOWO2_01_FULL_39_13 TaxID=1802624 RepID=A0A1F4V585_UNCKA|nr:MAG: hypothetical protein A2982_00455 [candidate division WWE3 bacterium RIFCSPLOWO2_01_FULL_39_13]